MQVVITAAGLRAKREALGISVRELALMTGIGPRVLGKLEIGLLDPDQEQRSALMRALDADFVEVFMVLPYLRRGHHPSP